MAASDSGSGNKNKNNSKGSDYTRNAFKPPTEKQKQQKAEAIAKGGLTPSGIKAYKSKAGSQPTSPVKKEDVTSSRLISEKTKLGTYEPVMAIDVTKSGQVEARTFSTGQVLSGQVPAGTSASQIGGRVDRYYLGTVQEYKAEQPQKVLTVQPTQTGAEALRSLRRQTGQPLNQQVSAAVYEMPQTPTKNELTIEGKTGYFEKTTTQPTSYSVGVPSILGTLATYKTKEIKPYDTKTPITIPQEAINKDITVTKPIEKPIFYLTKPKSTYEISDAYGTKPTLSQKAERYEFKALREKGVQRQVSSFAAFGLGAASASYQLVRHPVKTAAESVNFYTDLVTKPTETGAVIGEQLKTNPAKFLGEQVGFIATPTLIGKSYRSAQNIYVKTGSKEIPIETISEKAVLEGKQTFPKSRSVPESLLKFKKADDIVVTASPSKIKGTEVGIGGELSQKGLQDPGLYTTPKGKLSVHFLEISRGDYYPESISLLPKVGIPSATEFKTTGVTRLPKTVREKPGFADVKTYLEETGKSQAGKAFITKRSEIGLGGTKRQGEKFSTSELEAVIPPGQRFSYIKPKSSIAKLKGFEEYFVYEGRAVPIRKAILEQNVSLLKEKGTPLTESILKTKKSYSYSGGSSISATSLLPKFSIRYSTKTTSSLKQSSSMQSYTSKFGTSKISSNYNSSYRSTPTPQYTSQSYLSKRQSYKSTSYTSPKYESPRYNDYSSTTYIGYSLPKYPEYKTPTYPVYYTPTTPIPPPPTIEGFSKKTESRKSAKAYDIFIKRRGKEQLIGTGLPIGKALTLGKQKTLTTLAATFRVRERGTTVETDIAAPSLSEFRGYKIKKGQRVLTPGTFIQRTTKEGGLPGGRLASAGERYEIKLARLKI